MQYIKPKTFSFSEKELEKTILVYASCGAKYCGLGIAWGSTCGSAANYCPSSINYGGDTGGGCFGSPGNYSVCPLGANYTGPYSLNHPNN